MCKLHHKPYVLCAECYAAELPTNKGIWHNERLIPEFIMMSGEQMCLPARFMNIATRESLVLGSGREASMIVTNIYA